MLKICQEMGIGAQFGGKYFCHDVRVIRVRLMISLLGGGGGCLCTRWHVCIVPGGWEVCQFFGVDVIVLLCFVRGAHARWAWK